jgi:hypothetical protein
MDGFPIAYQGTITSALIVAEFTIFGVNQQLGDDNIECMNLMSLKYMIDGKGKPKAEYWAEALAGKLFMPGSQVCSFSTSIPGVDGCASMLNGKYVVFVRNETASTVSIPGILVNGYYARPSTVTSLHGSTIKDPASAYEVLPDSILKPFSITTFEFNISTSL